MTHPRPVPIPRRFEGRTVVVTGAGTGFGAAIALRAAQEGAKAVGIHYRSSQQGAEATARRVEEAGAATALFQTSVPIHEGELTDPAKYAGMLSAFTS